MQSTPDPTAPSAPTRILRRAGNLLTSTGQPACKELSDSTDATIVESPISSPGRTVRLRASIKRKFKEVKDASLRRSKSTSQGSKAEDEGESKRRPWRRHARSLSTAATDPTPTPAPASKPQRLFHSNTAPPATTAAASTAAVGTPALPFSAMASTPATRDEEGEVIVPQLLQEGTLMTKVSSKKHKRAVFRLDPDLGQIIWEGKQHRLIPIENIKELRSGSDARYYREQFQLAQEYEDRWLTIIYILEGAYKTLHLIAATKEVFRMWDTTLRKLHAIRQELMSGLGNIEMRQAIWRRHYWKGADEEKDQKLSFEEVEKLCRRLNVNSSSGELFRLFKQADVQQRNYLDFEDFQKFVKLLKGRPEIDRLYKKLRARGGGVFDFPVFEKFMREKQKSSLSTPELRAIFDRYSEPASPSTVTPPAPMPTHSGDPKSLPRVMTTDTFTAFLLSPDNSAFTDQHGRVWQDMTRPLADYYVSSSHNTYLVGHQLVGESTIEGYIRALLHSCRSVELDIYDGETPSEPQIFHGKTFTSKVSLRDICHAIRKYGFATSPYPIIISAEIHCSLAGQDAIADIMMEVFGDALVHTPHEGRIERLPSPEELKGRILLKTKNLYLASKKDSAPGVPGEGEYGLIETSASASSSTSDTEGVFEQQMREPIMKRRESNSTTVKELKDDLLKAGSTVLQRVKSVGKSSATKAQTLQPPPVKPKGAASLPIPIKSSRRTSSSGGTHSVLSSSYNGPAYPQSPAPLMPTTRFSLDSATSTPASPIPLALSPSASIPTPSAAKPKMSPRLLSLLVYTVGVKCRGINKKEVYAPEHMFSLSETVANRMLKSGGMLDLIKHCRTHLVRVYPKGTRVSSTNYEPHRYWSAGAQLVAINWQTFDLGYMINHAMFQRNGRAGYVLKPAALLGPHPSSTATLPATGSTAHSLAHSHVAIPTPTPPSSVPPITLPPAHAPKDILLKRTKHHFDVSIISAQQLPRPKDSSGREIIDKGVVDPFVEVSIHVPDWPIPPPASSSSSAVAPTPAPSPPAAAARTISYRTGVVKNNGFNPVWEEKLRIPFDCVGDMRDLVFVRFVVRTGEKEDVEPLAVYCASLGSLGMGYRHLPLHDSQLSQYLFSTLFVRIAITDT
ncbi:putative phospholipase C [Lyophyllum shimeji]|uniref:Phosphoinositide phospholipase C n=1 Tax=Lyophyllum shimeji TaxID=47721 RepID=A0A9P3UKI9_LYOSH|nr:putative phospholipase C [Lyophyllum shimeji]